MEETGILKPFAAWVPTGKKELDHQVLDLLQSGFFSNYSAFTEQIFLILNHQTFRYEYVSDNVQAVTGYQKEFILKDGLLFLQHRLHPEDVSKLERIFALATNQFKKLSEKEVLSSCLSYDYRMRMADNEYHRFLQHSLPINCVKPGNIHHALIIAMDISAYKKQNYCAYKLEVHDKDKSTVLLEGIEGELPSTNLTTREKEIIKLIASGFEEKQMADKLSISLQTVKSHKKNLIRKTGMKNSAELAKFAAANFLL